MPGRPGQLQPLPSAVYGAGTMSIADIYPAHIGIGGIRSSDWSIPAFAEARAAAHARALNLGAAPEQFTHLTPAGWLAAAIVFLVVGSWVIR
jgi:hypothetical protein